jgi:hypothetical protein
MLRQNQAITVVTGALCDAQFELWAETIKDKNIWEPLIKDWYGGQSNNKRVGCRMSDCECEDIFSGNTMSARKSSKHAPLINNECEAAIAAQLINDSNNITISIRLGGEAEQRRWGEMHDVHTTWGGQGQGHNFHMTHAQYVFAANLADIIDMSPKV